MIFLMDSTNLNWLYSRISEPSTVSISWICLVGDFLTDSTIVNHHETTSWGISFKSFPSTEQAISN